MGLTAPGLRARDAAIAVLSAVLDDDRPLDAAWKIAKVDRLSGRDAGFARVIALTALRRLGSIDATIDQFVKRRPVGKQGMAVHILRVAATELLALDAPAHAAVDCAVRLSKARPELRKFSGMINAVCRKLATEGTVFFDRIDAEAIDTPAWLWERMKADWGHPRARAIAVAHRNGAMLDLSVKEDPEDWAEALAARLLPNGTVRLDPDGAITEISGYVEGAWWAQDAAAALPAQMLGDVSGARVLDVCAAPGGKTMQLVADGAEVMALDLSSARARRLSENLDRTCLDADVVVADALDWEPDQPFTHILLDAPCSATGTIRRHPDLPHLKTGIELTALCPLQDALLDRAFGWLAPGGALVYAVCSILPEEGEHRLKAFLERTPDAEFSPVVAASLGVEPGMVTEGALRTLPSDWANFGGMDGFFAARIVRKA